MIAGGLVLGLGQFLLLKDNARFKSSKKMANNTQCKYFEGSLCTFHQYLTKVNIFFENVEKLESKNEKKTFFFLWFLSLR